jgi:hypothetical protein
MENVFLPTVDDADDGPAIAVGAATAVFLLDHMSSDKAKLMIMRYRTLLIKLLRL